MHMHIEVEMPNLVLMIPLTADQEERLEVLLEDMDDGQHEVRFLDQEWAAECNAPGQPFQFGARAIEDVVLHLFAALDTVTDAEVRAYRAFGTEEGDQTNA